MIYYLLSVAAISAVLKWLSDLPLPACIMLAVALIILPLIVLTWRMKP